MFSVFNPSKCTHTWSSGQPTLRRPGSSWGSGALLKGLTSVVDNSCRSRDSNPQPRVTSPTLYPLGQRFSIPVLAPPRSAHFLCYSYHFRCLFYSIASALRSGHHTTFLHDSSSKRTYCIHSELKCARCEFILYIFTDVYYVTLVCAWRCCAAQIHQWMFWSEVNFNGFPLLRE